MVGVAARTASAPSDPEGIMYNDYYDNGAAIAGLFVVFLISLCLLYTSPSPRDS